MHNTNTHQVTHMSMLHILLDLMLAHLHSPSINLIICGDININYLQTSSSKNQLDSLLALYNLYGVVDFLTRITETPPQP